MAALNKYGRIPIGYMVQNGKVMPTAGFQAWMDGLLTRTGGTDGGGVTLVELDATVGAPVSNASRAIDGGPVSIAAASPDGGPVPNNPTPIDGGPI